MILSTFKAVFYAQTNINDLGTKVYSIDSSVCRYVYLYILESMCTCTGNAFDYRK